MTRDGMMAAMCNDPCANAGQSTVCQTANNECLMVWGETVSLQDTVNRYGPGLAACALCAIGSDVVTYGGATPADAATCAVCAAPLLTDVCSPYIPHACMPCAEHQGDMSALYDCSSCGGPDP